jgi:hypothetical protein
VPEQERRAPALHGPVDDLRDLEVRIDLGVDLDELVSTPKLVDPLTQVGSGHRREL